LENNLNILKTKIAANKTLSAEIIRLEKLKNITTQTKPQNGKLPPQSLS
jgi:hypothetical protein